MIGPFVLSMGPGVYSLKGSCMSCFLLCLQLHLLDVLRTVSSSLLVHLKAEEQPTEPQSLAHQRNRAIELLVRCEWIIQEKL